MSESNDEYIQYRGKNAGKLTSLKGLTVFVWWQDEFREFSDGSSKVFGMGDGLRRELQDRNVDFIQISDTLIHVDHVSDYKLIGENNEVFHDKAPEPQWLIKVDVDSDR
jgi:hypothetical protein